MLQKLQIRPIAIFSLGDYPAELETWKGRAAPTGNPTREIGEKELSTARGEAVASIVTSVLTAVVTVTRIGVATSSQMSIVMTFAV